MSYNQAYTGGAPQGGRGNRGRGHGRGGNTGPVCPLCGGPHGPHQRCYPVCARCGVRHSPRWNCEREQQQQQPQPQQPTIGELATQLALTRDFVGEQSVTIRQLRDEMRQMQTNLQNSVDRLSQEVAALRAQASPGFTQGSGPAVAPAAAVRATVGQLAGSKRGRDEGESVGGAEEPKKKSNRGGKKKNAAKAAAGNAGGDQGVRAGEVASGDITIGDNLQRLPLLLPSNPFGPLPTASHLPPLPPPPPQAPLPPQTSLAGFVPPCPQAPPSVSGQAGGFEFTHDGNHTIDGYVFTCRWLVEHTVPDSGVANQAQYNQRVLDTARDIMDMNFSRRRQLAAEARAHDLDLVHAVWRAQDQATQQTAATSLPGEGDDEEP